MNVFHTWTSTYIRLIYLNSGSKNWILQNTLLIELLILVHLEKRYNIFSADPRYLARGKRASAKTLQIFRMKRVWSNSAADRFDGVLRRLGGAGSILRGICFVVRYNNLARNDLFCHQNVKSKPNYIPEETVAMGTHFRSWQWKICNLLLQHYSQYIGKKLFLRVNLHTSLVFIFSSCKYKSTISNKINIAFRRNCCTKNEL